MKRLLVIALLVVFGVYMAQVLFMLDFGQQFFESGVKDLYLTASPLKLKVANTVTAIVVNFRGFDTLGEVTVLFWLQHPWPVYCIKGNISLVIVQFYFLQVV